MLGKVFAVGVEHTDKYAVDAMHQFAEPGAAVEEPPGEVKDGMSERIDAVVCDGVRNSVPL